MDCSRTTQIQDWVDFQSMSPRRFLVSLRLGNGDSQNSLPHLPDSSKAPQCWMTQTTPIAYKRSRDHYNPCKCWDGCSLRWHDVGLDTIVNLDELDLCKYLFQRFCCCPAMASTSFHMNACVRLAELDVWLFSFLFKSSGKSRLGTVYTEVRHGC